MIFKVPPATEIKCWNLKYPDYVTHCVAKGALNHLRDEVNTGISFHVPLEEDVVEFVWDKLRKSLDGLDISPITFEQAWEEVNLDAGPGEPWCNYYSTKRDIGGNPDVLKEFLAYAQFIEDKICDDPTFVPPLCTFKVHSKKDKYSSGKFNTRRFRSIQGSDALLQVIMMRWLYNITHRFYDVGDPIYVRNEVFNWRGRIFKWAELFDTFGIDFTAYDKTVPANAVKHIVYKLLRWALCPAPLSRWIARQVAYAPLVLPDGEVLLRFGQNPSGEYLTTFVNSIYHLFMNYHAYSRGLDIPVSAVDEVVSFKLTGDDELTRVHAPGLLTPERLSEDVLPIFADVFGITVKADLLCGGFYPPGAHASYLGLVTVWGDGWSVPVPVEPCRNLAKIQWSPVNDTPLTSQTEQSVFDRVWLGIMSLSVFVLHIDFPRQWPGFLISLRSGEPLLNFRMWTGGELCLSTILSRNIPASLRRGKLLEILKTLPFIPRNGD
jgi:hypothetical protein